MEISAHANIFNTDSIAWVDIGLYRDAVKEGDFRPFQLQRLQNMDRDKVGIITTCVTYMLVLISKEYNHVKNFVKL